MSDEIHSDAASNPIEIQINPSDLGAILSCLLHCKFNGDVRLEFSTSPALNGLIKDILSRGRERRLSSPWFSQNYPFEISPSDIKDPNSAFYDVVSRVRERSSSDDINDVLTDALYPYTLEGKI